MNPDTDCWDELREFGTCEPSALAFRSIAALLETWPNDDAEEALAYAEQLLSDWPDVLRVAPWSWCRAASKGDVPSTWPLVRSLELSSDHLSKGEVDVARVAHYAPVDHISELQLSGYSSFRKLSYLYHRPDQFAGLKSLRAVDRRNDGDVAALADSPLWTSLESFSTEFSTE